MDSRWNEEGGSLGRGLCFNKKFKSLKKIRGKEKGNGAVAVMDGGLLRNGFDKFCSNSQFKSQL
jgi:hypothetical protein